MSAGNLLSIPLMAASPVDPFDAGTFCKCVPYFEVPNLTAYTLVVRDAVDADVKQLCARFELWQTFLQTSDTTELAFQVVHEGAMRKGTHSDEAARFTPAITIAPCRMWQRPPKNPGADAQGQGDGGGCGAQQGQVPEH